VDLLSTGLYGKNVAEAAERLIAQSVERKAVEGALPRRRRGGSPNGTRARTYTAAIFDSRVVVREAAGLLACGVSLFLFVSLWSSRLTGQVGSHVAIPLRELFGFTAYAVPAAGLAAAVNAMRGRPTWSYLRWIAGVGLVASLAILVELPSVGASCPSYTEPALPHMLGGIAGQFLAAVLCENFGVIGSYCFLLPSALLLVLASASMSIVDGTRHVTTTTRRAGERVTGWFEKWKRRERPPEIARVPRPIALKPNLRRETSSLEPPPPIFVTEIPKRAPEKSKRKPAQDALPFGDNFNLPSLNFLDPPVHLHERVDEQSLIASSRILENKLADFGVQGKVTAVRRVPSSTRSSSSPRRA